MDNEPGYDNCHSLTQAAHAASKCGEHAIDPINRTAWIIPPAVIARVSFGIGGAVRSMNQCHAPLNWFSTADAFGSTIQGGAQRSAINFGMWVNPHAHIQAWERGNETGTHAKA